MEQENQVISIWKNNAHTEWALFSNTNNAAAHTKESQKAKNPSTKQEMKMGSLYMTQKGIGRLIKYENGTATIKFVKNDTELTFPASQISSHFQIAIKLMTPDSSSSDFVITVPANGTVELIRTKMGDLGIVDAQNSYFFMIHKGVELKDESFFDTIGFLPDTKILICFEKLAPFTLERYTQTYTYWYTYATDGLTLSCNKKIKLTGVSFFGSHESKTQDGSVKMFEGSVSNMGPILFEDQISIEPAISQEEPHFKYMFKKAVYMKPGVEYTIQLISTNYCYMYYGNNAQEKQEGEKGVEFSFKYTEGSNHGTNGTCGNFGQIHYMI